MVPSPKVTNIGTGNKISWERPTEETQYNQTKLYRATTQTGTYSAIATLLISDFGYYDKDGTSSSWYKQTYYDSSNAAESGYSDAVSASTITLYTTIRKVSEFMNWYTEVNAEAVATGDSSITVFNLANKKVVEGTINVYKAGVLQVIDDDYTFDNDLGRITFTSAPAVVAITADYWYQDIPSKVVYDAILRACEEIDRNVGRSFYSTTSVTETYGGNSRAFTNFYNYQAKNLESELMLYRAPEGEYFDETTLFLRFYPILTVSSLTIDDVAITSDEYDIYSDQGRIVLTPDSGKKFNKGVSNISITYTYGYTSVPKVVEELATKIAAVCVMESRLLGSPTQSLDIRRSNIDIIREDIGRLYNSIGRKLEILVI